MESIEDRVGQRDLMDAAKAIRDAWKRREREEKERVRREAEEKRRAVELERMRVKAEERGRREGEMNGYGEEVGIGPNGNGSVNGVKRKPVPE